MTATDTTDTITHEVLSAGTHSLRTTRMYADVHPEREHDEIGKIDAWMSASLHDVTSAKLKLRTIERDDGTEFYVIEIEGRSETGQRASFSMFSDTQIELTHEDQR